MDGTAKRKILLYSLVLTLLGAILQPGCTDTSAIDPKAAAPRAPVELSAEVDKTEGTTGDVIEYTVELDRAPDIKAELPEIFSKIQGFKVSDIKEEGPINRDGRSIHKKTFKLRAFQVGSYVLPALKIDYQNEKGETASAGTPQIFVEIKSVLDTDEKQEDIADIKPALSPPPDYSRLQLIAGGVVLALLLLAGGYSLYRRRKTQAIPPPPPPLPWEVAREELAKLQAQALIEKGEGREHCYELSEIFRRYLEARYNFPAMEETTEEIMLAFRQSSIPLGRPRDLARTLLQDTDRVKFAKQLPSQLQADEMLQSARAFVDATVPLPPTPEAETEIQEVS